MRGGVVKAIAASCVLQFALACSSDPRVDPLEGLTLIRGDASDMPLPGLDADWRAQFDRGDILFEAAFRESQGLGPVYIRHSCASCHENDGRGPGTVLKAVLLGEDGAPLADQSGLPYGATIRPHAAGGAAQALGVPTERSGLRLTKRFGPAAFGRGYIEAILDSEIERVEAEQSAGEDGVRGRINRVEYASTQSPDPRFHGYELGEAGLIGRFGLKARLATLDDFTADAFQGDMGLTSPQRPQELPNPSGVDDARPGVDLDSDTINRVADYVRLLRIPTRGAAATDAAAAELFGNVGCARCHVPSLRTSPDYPVPQLADVDAPVYTDVLIHDMGPDFDDGLREHDASGSAWRTAPLMGLRHLRNYLHDGRAASIEEAILMHGGPGSEAAIAVDRFNQLGAAERETLLAFVAAL
jgi:CxxC motif-containing protein (DUF1111 family)